jgi:hypothetical protein
MSALGQKQTFAAQNAMSALPPKADMCGAKRHVRFVPIADILIVQHEKKTPAHSPGLLDSLG